MDHGYFSNLPKDILIKIILSGFDVSNLDLDGSLRLRNKLKLHISNIKAQVDKEYRDKILTFLNFSEEEASIIIEERIHLSYNCDNSTWTVSNGSLVVCEIFNEDSRIVCFFNCAVSKNSFFYKFCKKIEETYEELEEILQGYNKNLGVFNPF